MTGEEKRQWVDSNSITSSTSEVHETRKRKKNATAEPKKRTKASISSGASKKQKKAANSSGEDMTSIRSKDKKLSAIAYCKHISAAYCITTAQDTRTTTISASEAPPAKKPTTRAPKTKDNSKKASAESTSEVQEQKVATDLPTTPITK